MFGGQCGVWSVKCIQSCEYAGKDEFLRWPESEHDAASQVCEKCTVVAGYEFDRL